MFNLDKASVSECKAFAYDLLTQIQRLQNDLNTLNNAIAQKTKEETKKEEAPKK